MFCMRFYSPNVHPITNWARVFMISVRCRFSRASFTQTIFWRRGLIWKYVQVYIIRENL